MKSKFLRFGITLGISILILVSALLFTGVADAKTKINIQAEKSRYYKKQGMYIIEGNPYVEYKDYLISADLIEYYEDDDRANFKGNVVVVQNETRIHSERMEADLKDEAFVIDGNVDIYYVRKKKGDAKEKGDTVTPAESSGEQEASDDDQVSSTVSDADANSAGSVSDETVATSATEETTEKENVKGKNDVIKIRAQHVEFTQVNDADHLVANTDVTMEVDDQIIKSTYLKYQGDQELVIARENVEVIGEDEEELYTDEFTYWLEGEGEGFEATGGVKLEFYMDSDEDEDADAQTDKVGDAAIGEEVSEQTEETSQGSDQVEGTTIKQEDSTVTSPVEDESESEEDLKQGDE